MSNPRHSWREVRKLGIANKSVLAKFMITREVLQGRKEPLAGCVNLIVHMLQITQGEQCRSSLGLDGERDQKR